MVEELVARGADVNAADELGLTALIRGRRQRTSTPSLLLAKGADINRRDPQGMSALTLAALKEQMG
ncbi:MAG: hypothetical protein U0802_04260 [Candidatus Binatia bacterium]